MKLESYAEKNKISIIMSHCQGAFLSQVPLRGVAIGLKFIRTTDLFYKLWRGLVKDLGG